MTSRTCLVRSVVVAAVVFVSAAGCGDGSDGSPATVTDDPRELEDLTGQAEVVVQARDNTFVSQDIEVSPGTVVTFDNRGRNPHNVIPVEDGAFVAIEVDDLAPGAQATITFDEPGDYRYYCSLHGTTTAGMVGSVVVR